MKMTHRWRTRAATAGAGLLLLLGGAACSDSITAPTGPTARPGPQSGVSPLATNEQLYLIDNKCLSNNPAIDCQHANGSVIYTVQLSGTAGVNTLWKSLTGHCATDPAVDCDLWYDQAHIGALPDGSRVYAINRRTIGTAGNPVGYVDVATKNFVHVGQVSGIGKPDGLVLAAFSPAGELYVANQDDDRIYKINLTTLHADQSWSIARPAGVGMLDLDGADIAFDAAGVLYLYTNASKTPGDRGLYTVDLSTTVATSTRVGAASTRFFSGMAIRDAGAGNLVTSNALDDKYYEISRTTGAVVATYQMSGDLTDHLYGDMTVGRLTPPTGTASISGCVYPDLNGSGIKDVGLLGGGQYGIFVVNGGTLIMNSSHVTGSVAIGPGVDATTLQKTDISGQFVYDPTATWDNSNLGGDFIVTGGTVSTNLTAAQTAVNNASASYAAMTATQTFGNLTTSQTIVGNGGINVISIASLNYNSKTLTLSGTASNVFIINVAGNFTFADSKITLSGGVTAGNVVFNFPTTGATIDMYKATNVINGTFLAPHGTVIYHNPASFNGQIIAQNVNIHSDANLTSVPSTISEPCLAGATLDLANGTTTSTASTTAGYSFSNLAAATYSVTLSAVPTGYSTLVANPGTIGGSTVGTALGADVIQSIVLPAGASGINYDFGLKRN